MFATFRKYFAFGGSFSGLLKRGMAFSVLNSFFEAWQMMALAVVLFALADGTLSEATLLTALAIMLLSIAGCFITSHFKSENFCKGNFSMTGEKRTQIGDRMRYLPMGYFNENSLGQIAGTMTNTLDDVQNAGGQVYTNVISGFVFSGIMALFLLAFDWRLGAAVIVTIAVFLLVNACMQKKARDVSSRRVAAQGAIVGAVLEYIRGIGGGARVLFGGRCAQKARRLHRGVRARERDDGAALPRVQRPADARGEDLERAHVPRGGGLLAGRHDGRGRVPRGRRGVVHGVRQAGDVRRLREPAAADRFVHGQGERHDRHAGFARGDGRGRAAASNMSQLK